MIKATYHCDFCEKEVDPQEYIDQCLRGISATKEWDMHSILICKECAVKLDYALLKFKTDALTKGEKL